MRKAAAKLPTVGKHVDNQKLEPSANQMSPSLAKPEDFEVMENGGLGGETLPFDSSCGNTPAEYDRLLKIGRSGNKKPSIPRDERGRTLKA